MTIKNIKTYIIIIILATCTLHAEDIIDVAQALENKEITKGISFFEDSSRILTINEVIHRSFFKPKEYPVEFKPSHSVYWVNITINNSSSSIKKIHLINKHHMVEDITLYEPNIDDSFRKTTLRVDQPFPKANVAVYKSPTFILHAAPGLSTYFLRVDSISNKLDFFLFSSEKFEHFKVVEYAAIGFFFGCLFVMIFYYLFLNISFSSSTYFMYVCYIVSFAFYMLNTTGLFYQLFPAGSFTKWYSISGSVVSSELTLIFISLFVIKLLDISSKHKNLYNLIKLLLFTCVLNLIYSTFVYSYIPFSIMQTQWIIGAILLLVACVKGIRLRYRPAYFFTIAWAFYCGASLLFYLKGPLNLHDNLFTNSLQFIGGIIEILLLSFALSDKIKQQGIDNAREKDAFVKELLEKESAKEHAYNQLSKVVRPFQLEKIQNGGNLEETITTSNIDTCVIAFDIIKNPKINKDMAQFVYQTIFNKTLKGLRQILSESSDNVPYTSKNAPYKIKVTGKAFICAIGYPFNKIKGKHDSEASLELAEKLIQIFHEEAQKSEMKESLACSIDIAYGPVEVYFPKSKPKGYDIFSRGITLATRYSRIREQLYNATGDQGSIILMQENVFKNINTDKQEVYKPINLLEFNSSLKGVTNKPFFFYKVWDPNKSCPVSRK